MLLGKRGVWIVLAVSAAIFSIAPSLTHSLGWLVTCKEEKRGRGIGKEKKRKKMSMRLLVMDFVVVIVSVVERKLEF